MKGRGRTETAALFLVAVVALAAMLGVFAGAFPGEAAVWALVAATLVVILGIVVFVARGATAERRSDAEREVPPMPPGTLFVLDHVSEFTFRFEHDLEAWTNGWKVTVTDDGTLNVRFADGRAQAFRAPVGATLVRVGSDVYLRPSPLPSGKRPRGNGNGTTRVTPTVVAGGVAHG